MENFIVLRVLLLLCFVHKGKFLSKPYSSGRNKFLLGNKFLALFYYFPLLSFTAVLNLIKEGLG